MKLITLQAPKGPYVGCEQSYPQRLRAMFDEPVLFHLLPLAAGGAQLRVFGSDEYVVVDLEHDSELQAVSGAPGAVFQLKSTAEGRATIQHVDSGLFVSLADGTKGPDNAEYQLTARASAVESASQFILEEQEFESSMPGACCGSHAHGSRPGDASALWEERTHADITHHAQAGLRQAALLEPKLWAHRLFELIWNQEMSPFGKGLYQGLIDADDDGLPWAHEYYAGHFYDPGTRQSYNRGFRTALTEGQRYFNLAVLVGKRIAKLGPDAGEKLFTTAGHYLGLSLHFFTDLTQPMHASNFTNVYGFFGGRMNLNDLRHQFFEDYAETNRSRFLSRPDLSKEELAVDRFDNPAQLIDEAARSAKSLFEARVREPAKAKREGRSDGRVINEWGAEADPALQRSLGQAPTAVARFLEYWAKWVFFWDYDIDVNRWYRVVDKRKGHVFRKDGWIIPRSRKNDDAELFFLLVNSNGTVSFGCKTDIKELWTIKHTHSHRHWVGTDSRYRGDRETQFRLFPLIDGQYWIFEGSRDESLQSHPDTGVQRMVPFGGPFDVGRAERGDQMFDLEDAGAISEADKLAIKGQWSDWGTWPWWGKANEIAPNPLLPGK